MYPPFTELASKLSEEAKASALVIALGVNDARSALRNESQAVERWSNDYIELIRRVKRTGTEPVHLQG